MLEKLAKLSQASATLRDSIDLEKEAFVGALAGMAGKGIMAGGKALGVSGALGLAGTGLEGASQASKAGATMKATRAAVPSVLP